MRHMILRFRRFEPLAVQQPSRARRYEDGPHPALCDTAIVEETCHTAAALVPPLSCLEALDREVPDPNNLTYTTRTSNSKAARLNGESNSVVYNT